jgi:hypothetical protein
MRSKVALVIPRAGEKNASPVDESYLGVGRVEAS